MSLTVICAAGLQQQNK